MLRTRLAFFLSRRLAAGLASAGLGALALGAGTASATVLYKSIGPNGVVQFSDTPPEQGMVVEERILGSGAADGQPMVGTIDGLLAFQNPLELSAAGEDPAPDIARANDQVDLAEHALALARSSTWTRREGLTLRTRNRRAEDNARIAYYEQNLRAARARLVDQLNRGQTRFSPGRNDPGGGAPDVMVRTATR